MESLHAHESGDHGRSAGVPGDSDSHVTTGYGVGEDLRGTNAVFGLIGASATDDYDVARRAHDPGNPAMTGAPDVIQTLHEQYCRALGEPQASLAENWVAQWVNPVAGDPPMDAPEDHPNWHESATARESTDSGSIEALLSGARVLTDVFGPLEEGDVYGFAGLTGLTDSEPIPEILRLFAPAEYHAAASRRPTVLPPALARREHHSPGIDSPMPTSDTGATKTAPRGASMQQGGSDEPV